MIELLFKVGAGLISFVGCSILYFLGRSNEKNKIESESAKQALKHVNDVLEKQNKVRRKYDKIKEDIPTSWVDGAMSDRLRKKS